MENVLYIPGLGSERTLNFQRRYVRFLNLFTRNHIYFFEPRWESDREEDADAKYARLNGFVESIGGIKSVIGVSAGATLATRLALESQDSIEAHLICGKVHTAGTPSGEYHERAPALHESVAINDNLLSDVHGSGKNLDYLYCYIPRDSEFDGAIRTEYMTTEGATNVMLPSLRHDRAIIYALVKYLPGIAHGK